MEGHRRLPSAADMQGKSPPLPPALPPLPSAGSMWLVPPPAPWLSLPAFPNSCAWLIPRRSSPRRTNVTRKQSYSLEEPQEPN